MARWRNWSGRVRARPRQLLKPRDETDLAARIAIAPAPVRAVGSGHSFTALGQSEGTIALLDAMRGVTAIDTRRREATVLAGTTIRELGEPLAEAGLALANQGDIDAQTIAGAVATGTHGTGARLGSLASQVVGLRLVMADGTVRELTAENDGDTFYAAQVSLGALGIVTSLRLRLETAYRLAERRVDLEFAALDEQLDALIGENRHFEFFWFLYSDRVQAKILQPTDAAATPPAGRVGALNEVVVENGLVWLLSNIALYLPRLAPRLSRLAGAMPSARRRVGPSHRIFPSRRLVRFNEMEYALPREAGPAALREIAAYVKRARPAVFFPLEYRTVAAEEAWLSPFYRRDSVTIAVHRYARADFRPFFDAVEAIFRNHRGRPHWGKLHTRSPAELAELYPRWTDFLAVRQRFDPEGRFLNDYLRRLFGLQS